jgi:two-component sensor histidine kinase
MVGEGITSEDRPVRLVVEGDAGEVRAEVATPLAVVLTELLQNALEHAFPPERFSSAEEPPRVVVSLENDTTQLVVRVVDNGVGLPPDFALDGSTLGLTIVGALVTTDLNGQITMESDGGTVIRIRVPVEPSATAMS